MGAWLQGVGQSFHILFYFFQVHLGGFLREMAQSQENEARMLQLVGAFRRQQERSVDDNFSPVSTGPDLGLLG